MFRARWATNAWLAVMLLASGCQSQFPWIGRHHGCCDCDGAPMVGAISGFEGPVLAPPTDTVIPAPTPAPAPKIMDIPPANPIPYSPGKTSGLKGLFMRWSNRSLD